MSIIQDALKKVQSGYHEKKMAAAKTEPFKQKVIAPKIKKRGAFSAFRKLRKPTRTRVIFMSSMAIVFIASVLIAVIGMSFFSLYRASAKNKNDVQVKPLNAQNIPPKPKEEPAKIPDSAASHPPLFVLNGVMYLDGKPQAIINGYILEEGDTLNGATVLALDKDYVLVHLNDAKIKLTLNK